MSSSVLCAHFDTPEGRWTLVSEFTTEDAANQFVPHIGPKLGGDDLSMGASVEPRPPTPPSAVSAKFNAPSTLMVSGGLMFGDSVPNMGVKAPHALANRPTHVMMFQASEPVPQNEPIENSVSKSKPHGKGLVTKSTSSFVTRIVTNENLARWIIDPRTTYILFNAPKCFNVVGMQPDNRGETLARLDMTLASPTCYDVIGGSSRFDVVLGFVRGNIVWYEPVSGKYSRLNKNSGYAPAVVCVKWMPNSDTLFMVGMADGAVMVMDRTKDEFVVPQMTHAHTVFAPAETRPKTNPVSFWRVSNKPITSIEFSPDSQYVAITSEDGTLRIIDHQKESLCDVYESYFGGLTCCAWSNDQKYVVTGGKDDLVTVWSYYDKCVVARGQGHKSWVRGVAFDNVQCGVTYRFFSVGDDAQLLVWDLSLAALHRPRTHTARVAASPTSRARVSLENVSARSRGDAPHGTVHARMPKDSVAVLQPLVSEAIHDTPLCSLSITRDLLVTACRKGVVKVWKRPKPDSYVPA
ncbi:hypothetical protein LPJ62_000732 [Coemansia sp. RSA 2167]|nr:hypothetical protein LPJ62_000732 [Coemansia sp. RSA 2167]KAJ2154817.1 hypothetical protein J3F82_000886 [Coemansia sp. RSA 637]KAJ2537353.1 hypothetical protein IWW43_000037 [Coemansia sp. RSA 1935]